MEQIKIKVETEHIKYKALDGTLFNDKEECKKYEESAKCVLLSKYNKYVIKQCSEYDIFRVGDEYNQYDIVRTTDTDLIKQLWYLYHPNYPDGDYKREKLELIETCTRNEDYMFIFRSNDDDDYFDVISSFNTLFNDLSNYCQQ